MHLKRVTLHPDRYPTRDHYPFNLPVFHRTRELVFGAPVAFFVGENGTGKSTLLEAIAQACGIHIWRESERARFAFNPYERRLRDCIGIEWAGRSVKGSFFGSSIFQHFAEILDEWAASDPGQLDYFGGRSLLTQSHGQSFMAFFKSRYRMRGLYLLDEPETALSPRSQVELLGVLTAASVANEAQFIIATHSPLLLACPDAFIYSFDHAPIRHVPYEETDHYRIYRDFMENRDRYLTPPA